MKCQWVSEFLGAEPETDICSYVIFLRAILNTCNNLSIICEDGEVQIVDRGFRDVAAEFEEMGFDIKMPDFLDKNSKQFTSEQANETRLVTNCRWVVESFQACFKKWRMFAERIDQSFIPNIAALTRILAACINKYRAVLYDANSPGMTSSHIECCKRDNVVAKLSDLFLAISCQCEKSG